MPNEFQTTVRRTETLISENGRETDCYILDDTTTAMIVQIIETGEVLELKKFVQ